ncbi:MAG: hypothetical protein KJ947_10420 [Alphaproteobacteria bacterium]|nr:hypothetical protein [Alphaproteobacteria bacterium]MBU1549973.1 hypothetical protein [Alphaproteobacteria bacterium]MBU2336571.1 hypothetical protein [Alphaproteobacteria bacterium]MBU2387304.1 hypothetical protein [Alphaproteobacteria bacterium]
MTDHEIADALETEFDIIQASLDRCRHLLGGDAYYASEWAKGIKNSLYGSSDDALYGTIKNLRAEAKYGMLEEIEAA